MTCLIGGDELPDFVQEMKFNCCRLYFKSVILRFTYQVTETVSVSKMLWFGKKPWTMASFGKGSSERELFSHSGHVEHCRPVRRDAVPAGTWQVPIPVHSVVSA